MSVAVVCKDPVLKDGLLSLLMHNGGFRACGGGESVAQVKRVLPDDGSAVLVVVSEMLDTDDWIELQELQKGRSTNIIMITSGAASTIGQKYADALVKRSDGSSALFQMIRRYVGPTIYRPVEQSQPQPPVRQPDYQPPAANIYGTPKNLTRRELEVAQLVAQGMPNRRISQVLNLQEQSIKNLVSAIMRKLDCENRVQVALRLSGRLSTHA